MKGLFVTNCKPTRAGWYIVSLNGQSKEFWGLYVPRTANDAERWLLCIPGYFTFHYVVYKNLNKINWMPASYTDPYDCPLGGIRVDK